MRNISKAVFTLLMAISLWIRSIDAMEPSKLGNIQVSNEIQNHFKEDHFLITDYLKDMNEAELHFFWTTGRTINDNHPEYGANTKVDVGGAEYGEKFFAYLDLLLENSPPKLKVKFICDKITEESNQNYIVFLKDKFKDRFEVLAINDVVANIKKNLSPNNEELTKKIDLAFNNATKGNPVLASDVYRVVGMPYGHALPRDIIKTQYTYCDIDTFCYGMENADHQSLISSLFKVEWYKPFYFGNTQDNNDIIKLHIVFIDDYKKYCIKKLLSLQGYVLEYFNQIHYYIKKSERNERNRKEAFSDFFEYLDPLDDYLSLMKQVMVATGTNGFLAFEGQIGNLNYPKIWAGAWYAPDDILVRGSSFKYFDSLYWSGSDTVGINEREQFNTDFLQYKKALSAAFYAKRFGKNHPFNIDLKDYLTNNFPFKAESFKKLLKLNFELEFKLEKTKYTQWKQGVIKDLVGGNIPKDSNDKDWRYVNFYQKCIFLLKELGIKPDNISVDQIVKIDEFE